MDSLKTTDPEAHAAFLRCLVTRGPRKGKVKKSAPSMRDDPLAWAAWQGWETGFGRTPSVFGFMLAPPEHKDAMMRIWNAVSDEVVRHRKAFRDAVQGA